MRKSLAAKLSLTAMIAMVSVGGGAPATAQLAVVDVANVRQSTTTALQSVAAVAKQVQQYQTQLQQYQNQLKNTVAPSAYLWQQAQNTLNGLQNTSNMVTQLSGSSGGISSYLSQFKNPSYYQSSPCFNGTGCSATQLKAMRDAQTARQQVAMASNQSVIQGLQTQQASLSSEGAHLDSLMSNAQTAGGQMEAISYGNQFAASQAHSLVQLRSLIMSQQAAAAALQLEAADQKALTDAASDARNNGGANDRETGQAVSLGSGKN